MTMSYADSHNTSKQVQVSLAIIIPQPLHVTLEKAKISKTHLNVLRECLHDIWTTFAPERVHSGSLTWIYIILFT